jgi:hypothetical protein
MPRVRLVVSAAVTAAIAAAAYGVLGSRTVDAKTAFDCPYTLAQTYNTALRMVRVDFGFKVTERDPSAAYVMFDYKSSTTGDHVVPGSIEMLDSSRGVKVIVQLSQVPRYHEAVMSDALRKKLREDYGEPLRNRAPPADAGAESGASDLWQ